MKRSLKMTNNEKHNEDEFTFPVWLNEAFFENVLKNVETETVQVRVHITISQLFEIKLRLLGHPFRAETRHIEK